MMFSTSIRHGSYRHVNAAIVAIVALLVLLSPAQPLSPGAYTLVNVCHLDVSMTISPGSSEEAVRVRESSGTASLGIVADVVVLVTPIVCLSLATPAVLPFSLSATDLTPLPLRC
jgi:hypothetical protein